jgi:hypothetical protein
MPAATLSCPGCGADLAPDARFCAACGRRIRQDTGEIAWAVADRRTFGVLPGRERLRSVRARTKRLVGVLRARIVLALELAFARLDAERDRFHLRRQASRLSRDRGEALQGLGAAVLEHDPESLDQAKARVVEIDGNIAAVGAELKRVDRRLRERARRARRDSGATEAVEPVPEPVPEPEPIPSDPPGPVIVPEPEPVPHEPPGPVIVPEPQPPTNTPSVH